MDYQYLTRKFVLRANRGAIAMFGGRFAEPDNLLNDRLDYVLDMVQDGDRYPDVNTKAAFYFVKIVKGHMFNDGNKRTGLGAMQTFLNLNGYQLKSKVQPTIFGDKTVPANTASTTDKILENLANETADSSYDWEVGAVADFIDKNKEPLSESA